MTDLATLLPQQAIFSQTPTAVVSSFDQTSSLTARTMPAFATAAGTPASSLLVNKNELLQPFFGCGAALTDAACYVLMNRMTLAQRTALLTQAFGSDGLSFVRIALGTVDYTASAYATYDDVSGDTTLTNFSVAKDAPYILPILQLILQINPKVKVHASVWSPPASVKANGTLLGGAITNSTANFTLISSYIVKAIQAYHTYGIPIWAVSPQNEPDVNNTAYPSGTLSTSDEVTLIANLGAALDAAGLKTKILSGDCNWGLGYTSAAMANSAAQAYTAGGAYHWYTYPTSTPLSMATDLRPYPNKFALITEYFSGGGASNSQIGAGVNPYKLCAGVLNGDAIKYGNTGFIYWCLALQADGYPAHGYLTASAAGDTTANNNASSASFYQGLFDITTATGAVFRTNPAYIAQVHLSRFVKPGARVCANELVGLGADSGMKASTFLNPDGSVVAYLYNGTTSVQTVSVTDTDTRLASPITLNPYDMATVTWSSAPVAIIGTGALTQPGAPTNLTASASAGVASLAWTAPTTPGTGGVGGYIISRGTTAGSEVAVGVTPAGATSYSDPGLTNGQAYFWTVTAFGLGGPGAASNEATATSTASPPSAVTLGIANAPTSNILGFGATVNGVAVTSFDIYRGTAVGSETLLTNVTTGSTATSGTVSATYTDTGLTNGTDYFYYAIAKSTAGNAQSAEASGRPAATPTHYLALSATYNQGFRAQPSATTDPATNVLDLKGRLNLSTYKNGGAGRLSVANAAGNANNSAVGEWQYGYSANGYPTIYGYNAAGTLSSAYATATLASVLPASANGYYDRRILNASASAYTTLFKVGGYSSAGANVGGATVSVPAGSAAFFVSADDVTYFQVGAMVTTWGTGGIKQNGTSNVGLRVGNDEASGNSNGDYAASGSVFSFAATNGGSGILYNPDFTAQPTANPQTANFTDTATTANTWIPFGSPVVN